MQKFTTTDGLSLAYRDEGEGLPIIALSGLTRNSDDFNFVAPHLAGNRLIRLDYRGRGQSDWAPHTTYTVPQEAQDVLALMDHLNLAQAAFLGTSRGGLITMGLAAAAKPRLLGACLNDIGPAIEQGGLDAIMGFLGKPVSLKTYDEAAQRRAAAMQTAGFRDVPMSRWQEDVRHLFNETTDGLVINYDPALRDAVIEAGVQAAPDLWPFFDALDGLPLALIHGAASDLLTDDTVAEMQRCRPDMIYAKVPGRAHVPFLDEPESLSLLHRWIAQLK